MKIWFDTEFIDDGKYIELISIGMIDENGRTYYAENEECDLNRVCEWVQKNVVPHLTGPKKSRKEISEDIFRFAGANPEFWGYYADYDWVIMCQLFGRMMDLPPHWPMFCRDVNQFRHDVGGVPLPEQVSQEHNALADAIWTYECWYYLDKFKRDMKLYNNFPTPPIKNFP